MAQLTQQQQQNIIEAGRGAYRMLIDVSGNPHSKQPHRDLWEKGWRLERKKEEAKNAPRKPQQFRRKNDPTVAPVHTDRLARRFNDRRTRAA